MVSQPDQGRRGVRCADCQHLRVRERGSLVEPDSAYRVSGGSVSGPMGPPACAIECCPLDTEFAATAGPFSERVVAVVWRERDCAGYELAATS